MIGLSQESGHYTFTNIGGLLGICNKVEATQTDTAVISSTEEEVDTLIKGEAGDQAMLVIDICTQGTHPVG